MKHFKKALIAMSMMAVSVSAQAAYVKAASMDTVNALSQVTTTVVYAYASWCGACKSFKPVMDSFSKNNAATPVVTVDVDRANWFTYKVRAIPTVFIVRNGKVVKTHVGTTSLDALQAMVPPDTSNIASAPK